MGRLITVLVAFVFLASGCGSVDDGEQDQGQDGQDPAGDVQIGGVTLSASADQVEVGGNDTAELTAKVTDTPGDPVSGQTVTFTRTGPNQPGAGNYSGTGPTVTSSFTAAGGPTTFTLSHTGQSNYIVVLWDATNGERVTGLANEIGQVEREQVVNLTANNEYFLAVEEADGNWEISVEEGQVSPGGEQSLGQAQTNDKGEATLTYTSTEDAGDFQIQALAGTGDGAASDSVRIRQTPGEPAQVTLTVPDDLYANEGNQGDVRALVRDEYGNRVADGTTVDFSSSGKGGLSAETADTEDGVARVQLEAPSNSSPGLDVTADVNGQTASEKTPKFRDFTLGKPTIEPLADRDNAFRIEASLKDANAEVVGGEEIQFGTNGGRLVSGRATTNPDTGKAGVTLLEPPQGAQVTVTATYGTTEKQATLDQPPQDVQIGDVALSSTETQIAVGGNAETNVTAKVTDIAGDPVANQTITFSRTGPTQPNAGSYSGTGSKVTPPFTAVGGPTTFTLSHAGQGNYAVWLWDATAEERVELLVNEIGAVDGSQNVVNLTASHEYYLEVEHADGDWDANVEDGQVSTGEEETLGQAQTDDQGEAALTYTSTNEAGTFQVQALAGTDEGAPQDTVDIIQTPGAPAQVTLSAPEKLYANGGTQGVVRALVRDQYGNRVADGTTVDFSSSGNGGLASGQAATEDGVATVQIEAPSNSSPGLNVTADVNGQTASQQTPEFRDFTLSKPTITPVADRDNAYRVVVSLKDANAEVVGGEEIQFDTTGGRLVSKSATTDPDTGKAGVTLLEPAHGTQVTARFGTEEESTTLQLEEVASLDLIASSIQLPSDGSEAITVTALARDGSNRVVEGSDIDFEASSGALNVTQPTTDASGQAIAQLTPGGDPSSRTITVTASSGSTQATVDVEVSGTTLSLNGPSSLVFGKTGTLTATLQDFGGNGISGKTLQISSNHGNTLSTSSLVTGPAGQVQFDLTADASPDTDTITATGAGLTATETIDISDQLLEFTAPATEEEVPIDPNTQNVSVHWEDANGNPQSGKTVNFSTTRGGFGGNSSISTTATTNASGNASVNIKSGDAGDATITASGSNGRPSVQRSIEFIANTVDNVLFLQPNPNVVAPNGTSRLTAVVQDSSNNRVKNKIINFNVNDPTGGQLSTGSVTTGSQGRATTTYEAGSVTSGKDGIAVAAEVQGNPSKNDTASLTVARRALRITLGTGDTTQAPTDSRYSKTFDVLVTDANGNPVPGATVNLSLNPEQFYKGEWQKDDTTGDGNDDSWVRSKQATCDNEDLDLDGVMDTAPIDEDVDSDGELEPGNPATVAPASVETDQRGFAEVDVVYPQSQAQWVQVTLEATVSVDGSEGRAESTFDLPVLASETDDIDTAMPGGDESPYGTIGDCGDPN